jgi:hypothetical protein
MRHVASYALAAAAALAAAELITAGAGSRRGYSRMTR